MSLRKYQTMNFKWLCWSSCAGCAIGDGICFAATDGLAFAACFAAIPGCAQSCISCTKDSSAIT